MALGDLGNLIVLFFIAALIVIGGTFFYSSFFAKSGGTSYALNNSLNTSQNIAAMEKQTESLKNQLSSAGEYSIFGISLSALITGVSIMLNFPSLLVNTIINANYFLESATGISFGWFFPVLISLVIFYILWLIFQAVSSRQM